MSTTEGISIIGTQKEITKNTRNISFFQLSSLTKLKMLRCRNCGKFFEEISHFSMHCCEGVARMPFHYNTTNMNSFQIPNRSVNYQTNFLPRSPQMSPPEVTIQHSPLTQPYRKSNSSDQGISLKLLPVEEKKSRCQFCGYIFSSLNGAHCCPNFTKTDVECYICNKVFLNDEELGKHLKEEVRPLT